MTYTEAITMFRTLPPEVQSFWRGVYDLYTRFSAPDIGPPLYDGRPRSPITLFWYSVQLQEAESGNPAIPFFVPGDKDWSIFPDSPVGELWQFYFPLFNQWTALPLYPGLPVRAKYRIKKSYWTGTPRRRRNL